MASATSDNFASSSTSSRHMRDGTPNPNAAVGRHVSSPWTQIVRGESETIAAAAASSSPQFRTPIEPMSSESVADPPASLSTVEGAFGDERSEESGGQGNAGTVWNRPSYGYGDSEVGPVMGASSWPALSDTTRAPSNQSSSDSLTSLGDVPSPSLSLPLSQGTANASSPAQVGRANPNPTPNYSRQRSLRRNGPSGSANDTVSQPSVQGSFTELPSHNPYPRGQNQRNGFPSQNHGGTDNVSQRDSYRNHNGNHHQSHGGRRNQEHRNQNWTHHRSFNGREGNAQPQRGAPPFVRHAPPPPVQPMPPHFMAAQPIQPFVGPLSFPHPHELATQYYPHHMPFMTPFAPPPMFYPVQEPPLHVKIQNQVHYWFSKDNLLSDIYLRGCMDEQGFVPLHVIARFKKMKALTDSIQEIVEALQGSPEVEVQGDSVRKIHDWQNWLLPREMRTAVSSSQSVGRADAVGSQLRNLSLDQSSVAPIGNSNSLLQPTDGQQQSSLQ